MKPRDEQSKFGADRKPNSEAMKKVNGTWHGQKPTKRPGRMKIIEMRSEMWLKAKPCRNQQALKDLSLI